MNKLIKSIKYHLFEPDLDSESKVRFIHHKPKQGNIGDNLCSPKHYIDFSTNKIINIIGGGVFNQLGLEQINLYKLDPNRTILWGAGQSIANDNQPKKITHTLYPFWGVRDIDSVDDEHFLPCVSCMHPMLNTPLHAQNTLLFLNFDKKITQHSSLKSIQNLAKQYNHILLYNNCTEIEFQEALSKSSHIITNSFHGAYWGLLSGRSVALIGYSSKFYSLYRMFSLNTDLILKSQRGNIDELINKIHFASTNDQYVCANQPSEFRKKFIQRQLNFINNLKKSSLFEKIEIKTNMTQ